MKISNIFTGAKTRLRPRTTICTGASAPVESAPMVGTCRCWCPEFHPEPYGNPTCDKHYKKDFAVL